MKKVIKFVVEVHFNGDALFTEQAHRRASLLLQGWLNEKVQDPKADLWMLVKPLQAVQVVRKRKVMRRNSAARRNNGT